MLNLNHWCEELKNSAVSFSLERCVDNSTHTWRVKNSRGSYFCTKCLALAVHIPEEDKLTYEILIPKLRLKGE